MSKKLKMVQLCAVGFTVEKLLLPLVDEMSNYYDVTVVSSRDAHTDALKEKGYNIENIEIDRRINLTGNIKSLKKLYSFMKNERIDILHAHTPVAGILGRIAARMAGVPISVYTAHGFYFHDNMSSFKRWLFKSVERVGGWFSDYIFTQSTEDYNTAIKEKIITEDKISVIGNGVDITRFDPYKMDQDLIIRKKQEFSIKEDELVVGIIGRVVKEKGYVEWVKAANEVIKINPKVKFLAIGDTLESDRDGVRTELDTLINEYGIKDNVIFAGSRRDVPELLSIMDIFTLPSYREGMPRSLIEAMSMKKPAVATDIRGCREEIEEGITGFLIPVEDYKSLADKLLLLIGSPEMRQSMGKKAREKVLREFDERIVLRKQVDKFSELVYHKLGQEVTV